MTLTTSYLSQRITSMKAATDTAFTHGAVGHGTSTPTAGDTALQNEDLRVARNSFDSSVVDKITGSFIIGYSQDNGVNIAECGWFNDPTAGTMWVRNKLSSAIAKTSDLQVYIDTEVTFTDEEM